MFDNFDYTVLISPRARIVGGAPFLCGIRLCLASFFGPPLIRAGERSFFDSPEGIRVSSHNGTE